MDKIEIIDERVRHSRFGNGVVIEQYEKSIKVKSDNGEIYPFAYPDAFEKFLVAEDEKVQKMLLEEIGKTKTQSPPPLTTPPPVWVDKTNPGDMVFRVGDTWQGTSYVDMINKTLHTNYNRWQKATVNLDKYGLYGTVAWFVHMDGSTNGTDERWLWQNYISDDGTMITEKYASRDLEHFSEKMDKEKMCHKRAAFKRYTNKKGKIYKCEFVGYFEMVDFNEEKGVRIYRKKSDIIVLHN